MHERLGETNELLRTLVDRTPAQAQTEGGAVELREPAVGPDAGERPAPPAEPAQPKKPAPRQAQRARSTETKKEV